MRLVATATHAQNDVTVIAIVGAINDAFANE